jgi:hypothetical protein
MIFSARVVCCFGEGFPSPRELAFVQWRQQVSPCFRSQGRVSHDGPADFKALHHADERCARQPQLCNRTFRAANYPTMVFKSTQDRSALDLLQSSRRWKRGNILRLYHRQRIGKHSFSGENHGALDPILQLAYIARPAARAKHKHRFPSNVVDLLSHPAAKDLDEVSHLRRNVHAACTQPWQMYRKHVQTVVKVTAKFALLYHLRQIAICCRHQPNVHLMSPIAAQAFNAEDGRGLGRCVISGGELAGAIEAAVANHDGPTLIECIIDRDDCSPELISWGPPGSSGKCSSGEPTIENRMVRPNVHASQGDAK